MLCEWSAEDEPDVEVEVLVVLLARLCHERCQRRNVLLRYDSDDVVHVFCQQPHISFAPAP